MTISRNELAVITGLSGFGKSLLVFDTFYVEGQRRYVGNLARLTAMDGGELTSVKYALQAE